MFTIKCYTDQGRCVIRAADHFTILRDARTGEAEITLHNSREGDTRVDILPLDTTRDKNWPPAFQWAYIENSAGKTVEHLHLIG